MSASFVFLTEMYASMKKAILVTKAREKTMYVAEDVSSCNVRNADSTKAEIIGGLRSGNKVQVTGITSNGWYRIKYYGETAYVADVLSNEKPEEIEEDEFIIPLAGDYAYFGI